MSYVSEANAGQNENFVFTAENAKRAEQIVAKYPAGRQASAVIPLLYLAQSQHDNWLPRAALDYVADYLEMAPIRVYEVATFYTMFNLEPVGRHLIQICRTTPCWLRGSDAIAQTCHDKLGIHLGETTADGKFSLKEVECLGACVNAPMVQINDDYFEDLTPENMGKLLEDLAAGRKPVIGSQAGRINSMAQSGATTLQDKGKA